MTIRTQVTIDPELQRLGREKAAELGISFAEYVRRLLARDLDAPTRRWKISAIFDLVDEGPPTNIARDKDEMIGEAVWKEHLRKTTRHRTKTRHR